MGADPMILKTTASPSKGAREIAEKLGLRRRKEYNRLRIGEWEVNLEAANLIDAELAEVLPYMSHKRDCRKRRNGGWITAKIECTCGLAALLERFTPGKASE